MTKNRTLATVNRILQQIKHDHRTIALIVVVPTFLMGLLSWILSSKPDAFNQWGGPLLGIFPLIVMFLITSVATLRERTSGTLERLMTMPIKKTEFIFAYALAFCILGTIQAVVAGLTSIYIFGLETGGNTVAVICIAILDSMLGTALGLLASSVARTEFQAVQFMPVVLIPQFLLGGFIVPRDSLPSFLNFLSDLMPLSYSVDALSQVFREETKLNSGFVENVLVVLLISLIALALGGLTLRRSSK